ncbi:MAG: GspE/PulE family protein, partial [Planctomycetota bacterium]
HCILPLFHVEGKLTVAVTEPANVFLIEEIGRRAGCGVQIVAATRGDIRAMLEQQVPESEVLALDDITAEAEQEDSAFKASPSTEVDLTVTQGSESDSPVVKLVHHAIFTAIREGASDIHFEPDDRTMRVRFRIDGHLVERQHPPYQMHQAIVSRIKIMAGMDISERRLPQDGAIRVTADGNAVDLRVSTLPNKFGEKVVIRVIDNRNVLVNLDELGMGPELGERFRQEVHKPHGIILVTGPTGSGKSTTLYAALNQINAPEINICTVEDPVEFNLAGVNQFQVHDKIGLSFAGVLRSLLRQDPDVIMVGEIRDPETARIAVQASLTGHLVLSTLHTNDAAGAITRLHNLGIEPYLISASLLAILGQRLVRRVCPDCVRTVEAAPNVRHAAEKLGLKIARVSSGQGCSRCHQSGLKGRTGIYELLVPDDEMRDAITGAASLEALRKLAIEGGTVPLKEAGIQQIRLGETTIEEVLRVTAS